MREEIIGEARLILGDCREVLPTLGAVGAVVSDPPYPNGEGLFLDGISTAREILANPPAPLVLYFWSEVEDPFCPHPTVARHIWHRTNVNGKIYEPILHFAADGIKRRSEIKAQAAIFNGVGPGCSDYEGHPTQKPVGVMLWLLSKCPGSAAVLDPFMGSGSTGVACVQLRRPFIGCEIHEPYFDIACRRIAEAYRQPRLFDEPPPKPVQEALL